MKFTQMIAGQVKYNRAAIMKEGWALKKDGIEEGISIVWKMARNEKSKIDAEIEIEEALELEEIRSEKEFREQIWEDAAIDPNFTPGDIAEENIVDEEETDPSFIEIKEELIREDSIKKQLDLLNIEELYKMAKDLKGKNMELETMIARLIIRKKRKDVA